MGQMNLVPVSFADYRALAQKRLPRQLFDYIDGGAYGEHTLAANTADMAALRLKQRVLRDVAQIDTGTSLFGEKLAMPLILAPVGLAGMMARRAEVQAVRAAEDAGLPFCLSTVSICAMEEVARAAHKPFWYQLYMLKERAVVRDLLARARAVGCRTLVFTVDLAVVGARYRDARNGLAGGLGPMARLRAGWQYPSHPGWLVDVAMKGRPLSFGNLQGFVPSARSLADFKGWVDSQFDPSCTWEDIAWLRSQWHGNLLIKGILSAEDGRAAVAAGADGIIVSNHGGRQLDGVSSTIAIVPEIRAALGDKAVILMDGGIRSGLDVLKARASGADAVLIGRPWIYPLAARGQNGLAAALRTFRAEMKVALALTGTPRQSEIDHKILDKNAAPVAYPRD